MSIGPKIFIVNGAIKTRPPQITAPTPLTSLGPMLVGGWGDPHLYVKALNSSRPNNPTIGKILAKWGDNKSGAAGNNELKLIDLETSTDTIKIYYTNKNWNPRGKVVASVRVELNGTSVSYSDTAKIVVGPITLSILKKTYLGTTYLNFEIYWSRINNIVKLGGAIVVILKRIAARNGKLWNGGDGANWDGFGKAAAIYNLSRSSFETGVIAQSIEDEIFITENESNFLSVAVDNFISDADMFDDLEDRGENGEGDNAAIDAWDDTYAEMFIVYSTPVNESGASGFEAVMLEQVPPSSVYNLSIDQNISYIP